MHVTPRFQGYFRFPATFAHVADEHNDPLYEPLRYKMALDPGKEFYELVIPNEVREKAPEAPLNNIFLDVLQAHRLMKRRVPFEYRPVLADGVNEQSYGAGKTVLDPVKGNRPVFVAGLIATEHKFKWLPKKVPEKWLPRTAAWWMTISKWTRHEGVTATPVPEAWLTDK